MDNCKIPPQLETTYCWEILNFNMCPLSIGECLKSNSFYLNSIDVSEYQLKLYPRGRYLDGYETTQCLLECNKESEFCINVTMKITCESEQLEMKKENFLMTTKEPISFVIERLKKPMEKVRFGLLPWELFTVSCTITLVYDPQTEVPDLVTLSDDLERFYQSARYSDFCLVAIEGRRFPVHKLMLTARCPVLAKKVGIFDRGECKERQIQVTSEALEIFLEYIYTGKLRGGVATEVLYKIFSLAIECGMDDLKRVIFPPKICTVGRTTIKVKHHEITWTIENLRTKVENDDWLKSKTLIDLHVCQLNASFSVVTDGYATTAHIDMTCLKFNTGRPVTMKCVVIVPFEASREILCQGEYQFYTEDPGDVFRLKGDLAFLFRCKLVREFPESLTLVLDLRVSCPPMDTIIYRCSNMQEINSRDPSHQIWKPSLHRLSADLDTAYKDTYEGNDSEWKTHSDLRVRVGSGQAIPVHRFILSARSDSLMSRINKNVLSAVDNTSEIHLSFINLRIVHNFMRYVYSGKFSDDVDMKDIIAVYTKSVQHEVKSLTERCLHLIRSKMELKDLKYLLAALWDNPQLKMVALNFVSQIHDNFENTPEWAEIMREMPCRARQFLQDVISGSTTG